MRTLTCRTIARRTNQSVSLPIHSAFYRFALFPNGAARLHFADVIGCRGNLATVFPKVRGDGSDFFGEFYGKFRERSHVASDGNEERVHPVARRIRGGLLRLRSDRRTVEGAERPGMFAYTQGLVSSHGKFDYTHGYIEICAKYPGGKGMWPCFWLMPQHQSWPPEFDIAEYYGGQRKMHHGLAHGTAHEPRWDSTGDSETDFTSGWHTYSLEWMPGRAVWSVDCIPRKIVNADYVPNVAMYVILSNSVSSRLGPSGEPDENTVFPNYFEIDYVRVYQPPPGATIEAPLVKNGLFPIEVKATEPGSEPPKPEPVEVAPVP